MHIVHASDFVSVSVVLSFIVSIQCSISDSKKFLMLISIKMMPALCVRERGRKSERVHFVVTHTRSRENSFNWLVFGCVYNTHWNVNITKKNQKEEDEKNRRWQNKGKRPHSSDISCDAYFLFDDDTRSITVTFMASTYVNGVLKAHITQRNEQNWVEKE